MRVLLIAGGWSSEREVSLSGAAMIRQALETPGHETEFLDPAEDFASLMDRASACDFAFINLHGAPGEDGLIQLMLDKAGVPYQGSGPAASQLALNKAASKAVFRFNGLPTPAWRLAARSMKAGFDPGFPLPAFVKPNQGGSSLGMSLVRTPEEFKPALDLVHSMEDAALVEEYVAGAELTCSVLGDTALPLILIRPGSDCGFFDYDSKYTPGGAEEICPAPVPPDLAAAIQDIALRAHRALGLSGYSRADFIVRGDEPFLLEMNTLPGMTPTSLVPQAAAEAGYDFAALVAELIRLGLAERGRK